MASNVLEFQRFERPVDPRTLAEQVTIRERGGILPAALCLAREIRAAGLGIMIWPDIATLAAPVDAQGADLNAAVFGWDAALLAAWQDREAALQNPVLRACRVESEPFRIDRAGVRTCWPNPLAETIAAADLAERCGFPAAIVVPVHLPFGQIGAAVLTGLDPDADALAESIECDIDSLAPALRRFLRGYATASRDSRYLPPQRLLTPREVECLSWVAQGKTDFEISIILGCSHAGVRYHITRACERLGAVNRAQSVFRASQLGYLSPVAP